MWSLPIGLGLGLGQAPPASGASYTRAASSNGASGANGIGSQTEFLTKSLDDSAWFCVEKLKKRGFEIKNLKI